MTESNNEIIFHPTCRKTYTRKKSVKSSKKSIAENPSTFTQIRPLKEKLRKYSSLFKYMDKYLLYSDTLYEISYKKKKKF